MQTDLVPAELLKRLRHQADLDGLSLAEMLDQLVTAMEEDEHSLDGRAYRLDRERAQNDCFASDSESEYRRRLERWVSGTHS
jgi:hypothetical protein